MTIQTTADQFSARMRALSCLKEACCGHVSVTEVGCWSPSRGDYLRTAATPGVRLFARAIDEAADYAQLVVPGWSREDAAAFRAAHGPGSQGLWCPAPDEHVDIGGGWVGVSVGVGGRRLAPIADPAVAAALSALRAMVAR